MHRQGLRLMPGRRGFSVLEVLAALLLLAVAVAGIRSGVFARETGEPVPRSEVERFAADRLAAVVTDTGYETIEERYRGIEIRLPGLPGYTRVTNIVHRRDSTAAGVVDFKRITVTLTGPGLDEPVIRSATVTAAGGDRPHVRIARPD